MSRAFSGAKVALFVGPDLLCLERDHTPDIPWPGHWDLPGGAREGGESPEDCVCRETLEETGLTLCRTDLTWQRAFDRPHGRVLFFAAHLRSDAAKHIVLGDEGCGWRLFAPDDYVADPMAVPHLARQVAQYLEEMADPHRKTPRS